MMEIIDNLLKMKPYSMKSKDKTNIFLKSVIESLQFHYTHCEDFKKFCITKNFDPYKTINLESIPFLPSTIFKKLNLISVPKAEIVRTVYSSSTSGNLPSVIHLDKTTISRQIRALHSIMTDFLGDNKRDFLIVDNEKVLQADNLDLSSRGSAIRGMLNLAKNFNCILNDQLEIDIGLLKNCIEKIDTANTCVFGFTWLIYRIFVQNSDEEIQRLLSKLRNPIVLHIGGWKRLKEINVDKNEFNKKISKLFNTIPGNVMDFYGLTEQLGTVYPDCPMGYKHMPLYSEILIRDTRTQQVLPFKNSGFIQLISSIPRSYPGVSILTDDIGELVGEDDCPCGRKGKYFIFKARSELAEPKGCGDTLTI